MSTVEEIESAIEGLEKKEFLRLAGWLEAKLADFWDQQMERDAHVGNLDFLFQEAETERKAGELKPWPAAK